MPKRSRRRARLENWLNATTLPVFLLDARRRFLFSNAGCEQLTGWSAAELRGQTCQYTSEPDHAQVGAAAASLCPPPEVFQGKTASVPMNVPHRSGAMHPRLVHYYPLPNAEGDTEYVLGVVTPVSQPHPVTRSTAAQQLHAELAALRQALRQRYGVKTLIGRSEPMRRVLQQIQLARQSLLPVLLVGEPGTGKEHIARAIHYESEVGRRSFVPLDCSRLPAWELKRTLRRLQEPTESVTALQPGTIYFDHVDRMPRDLQESVAAAFGPDKSSMRLMAASPRPLTPLLTNDQYRPDLYYLLTTFTIVVPPLRSRPEDLAPLAQFLLETLNRGDERQVGGFADDVWEQFRRYQWPGNVDELQTVITEARAASTGPLITLRDLPFRFRTGLDAQSIGPVLRPKPVPLDPLLAQVEREQIELALAEGRQNKSKAAELLGITRARLYRRMQVLGIEDREPDDPTGATT